MSEAGKSIEWILDNNYINNKNYSYEDIQACYWVPEEIDLATDIIEWKKLTDNERHFIKCVLAFFAASDGIVLENLGSKFLAECKVPEIRAFYAFQIAMENIHSETYSLLIDTYLESDPKEKLQLFRAIQHMPAIQMKADWALKWINNKSTFAERVFAFCCVEGIMFSGSFCAIYWLKKRSLMPGLTFSNELISRDEGLHTEFGTLLYNTLENRLTDEKAYQIVTEALEVEKYFINDALPVSLIGMNAAQMIQYLEHVSNRLLEGLRYKPIFKSKNPFPWMELIGIQAKTNFFEKRISEYQTAGVKSNNEERSFMTDANF